MRFGKRLISAAAVIVFGAAVLYGSIYNQADADGPGEVPVPSQKETIYFWYADESMSDFVNSAAISFGERENVRVIPVLTSESEYLEAVNNASLYSEQIPDVCLFSHDMLEKAYLAGLATEIQDDGKICTDENFPPAALSAVSYQGKLVAYPLSFETSALVYNDTYLAQWARQAAELELTEAGLPLDEAAVAAKTEEYFGNVVPEAVDDILDVANIYDLPEGVESVFKWDVSDILYNYWIVGNYMTVGGEAGDDEKLIDIDSEETIRCLDIYKALNEFFFIEPDRVTYDSVLQDFIDGKIVFTIVTTDAVKKLAEAEDEGTIWFDYGFAPLPDVSRELKSRAMSVTIVAAVNGYSRHKELANSFAAYLVNECADTLYDKTDKVPARLGTNKSNGSLQTFKREYADSVPLPKMMETENFWLQLEGLFAKVWNGADVREMVEELSDRIISQTRH